MFKAIVNSKNEFYFRHIAKTGLLNPIITLLINSGQRYNLINSAMLELLETIRRV